MSKRRFEEWRRRGLLERPRLAGYQGRRPLWVYPADAGKRLRMVVRLREQTADLDAVVVMLWARGFTVPSDVVRAAVLGVIDRFERGMLRDLARFASPGINPERLLKDPQALSVAVERYADELARRRSRSPLKHTVRMNLAERQRGVLYMLAPLFDRPREEQDAVLVERLYGIGRGRSGTAGGLLTYSPSEYFETRSLTPQTLRTGVAQADELSFTFVATVLRSLLTLLPAFLPIFISAESTLREFIEDMTTLFRDPPPQAIALLAAALIRNTHERRAVEELTPELVDAVEVHRLGRELYDNLPPHQKERLYNRT